MNKFKKIYCRTFQTVFKIAIPFLPYRKPEIVGSVKKLPEILQKKKCESVLIITDAGIMSLGLTKRLEQALSDANIQFTIYDKTVANPKQSMSLKHWNSITKMNVMPLSVLGVVQVWTAPKQLVHSLQDQTKRLMT